MNSFAGVIGISKVIKDEGSSSFVFMMVVYWQIQCVLKLWKKYFAFICKLTLGFSPTVMSRGTSILVWGFQLSVPGSGARVGRRQQPTSLQARCYDNRELPWGVGTSRTTALLKTQVNKHYISEKSELLLVLLDTLGILVKQNISFLHKT